MTDINHGLYTDCAWSVASVFTDTAGDPVDLSGEHYIATAYARDGSVVFVFKSNSPSASQGSIDRTDAASGILTFTAAVSAHAGAFSGVYRVHLRIDETGDEDRWQADGSMLVGKPGARETYLKWDRFTSDGDAAVIQTALLPQLETLRDDVEADRAEVAANLATVEAAEATVTATAAEVAADAVAVSADTARAVIAADDAEASANAASLAALEVAAAIPLYATTAAGIAATVDGEYFRVAGDNTNTYTELYKNVTETAVFVASVTSKVAFDAAMNALNRVRLLDPADDVIPIFVVGDGKVALGLDVSVPGSEKLVGAFVYTEDDLDAIVGDMDTIEANTLNRIMMIDPPGDVIPMWVIGDRIVLGFDTASETLTGAFAAAATAADDANASNCEIAGWNGLVGYGQSLAVGAQSLPLLSTSQPYSNITFNAGPRSTGAAGDNPGLDATKALVEDEIANYSGFVNPGETPCSGAANTLSESAAWRAGIDPANLIVLASTAGHGGYRIDELDKAAAWYPKLIEHVQAGADLTPDTYACNVVFWIQGEADAIAGTTAASYKADLIQLQLDLQADIRAITGQHSPVYLVVMQTTHLATTTGAAIQQAQYEAAVETDEIIIAAPMYHLGRYSDGIHLSNTGSRQAGAHIGDVAATLIAEGVIPDKWECVSAVARGTSLRLKFNAPVLPLFLDTSGLASTTDYGFAVSDGTGTLTLSGIAVQNDDEVVLTLNRSLGASPVLRYARDYMAASGPSISGGASGNLRDSNSATVILGGTTIPLWTPCPAFEIPIIKL